MSNVQSTRMSLHRGVAPLPADVRRAQQIGQLEAMLPAQGRRELTQLLSTSDANQPPLLSEINQANPPTLLDSLTRMVSTSRAPGLSATQTLAETVHLLASPGDVRQPFAPTDASTWQALLQLNQPGQNPAPRPWTTQELTVESAHTCAAAAELSRLASQHRDQFARLAEEITRPSLTATTVVTPNGLGAANTGQLHEKLRQLDLTLQPTAAGQTEVSLAAPVSGLVRAVNAQHHPSPYTSTGVEVLLQSALMAAATHQTYNPAVDQREQLDTLTRAVASSRELPDPIKAAWQQTLTQTPKPWLTTTQFQQWLAAQTTLSPAERDRLQHASEATDVGLHESEEVLMQTLLEPDTPWRSLTCQVTMRGDPGPSGKLLLAGYTQPFEQTTADLLEALLRGHEVIIGLTLPDRQARIQGGHIVKIAGYEVDPVSQRLSFLVADSDDTQGKLVPRQAADLVPLIHHMSLPQDMAERDWAAIRAHGRAFYRSGPDDRVWFHPTPLTRQPFPINLLLPGEPPVDLAVPPLPA